LAFRGRTTLTPILLTYDNESMYLHVDPQGCALFGEDSPEPFYRIQEPLLLAHGIMTDCKTVHLVVLKTSGELCYTLISGTSTPQTTLIAQLDVSALRYRRLFLFPQGKIIHIFYAHAHHAIRDLWRIEHRYWDGSSWHSVHLGEVVHQREPLYHVNLDSQGNLHLLTITFQGRHSLLYTNRFNGTFRIWGSPTETLKIPGEVADIAALMTPDNVHHLYWVVKTPNGQFEIRWAQQTDAHELASTWHASPAPIKTFRPPWKGLGALEFNGVLWLLAHTGEEVLMKNNGKGWKLISSHTPFHQPFKWVHKGRINFHQTYWLEDQAKRRAPAYYHELGFTIKKETAPVSTPFQTTLPILTHAIPPVPAFYPDLISPDLPPPTLITVNQSDEISSTPSPIEVAEPPELFEALDTPESPSENVLQSLPLKENVELERLITTVAYLEQENTNMSLVLQTMLSKFDQLFGAITDNVSPQTILETSFEEIAPVKEAMSNLEKETNSLSQVLRVMLDKQEQSDSSLENLAKQISQLQQEKEEMKNKGGFWSKWTT